MMNQVWHIFRKDTRHFWREIVVLFALLIVYAWNEVRSWAHPDLGATALGSFWAIGSAFPGLVGVLIPIIWLVLVIRIVQDEALVGDRQFWVTRPYEWRAVLAGKALFLLAFVSIPLFLLQVFLLETAQFSPHDHLSGLLFVQIGIFIFVLVPAFCLSSITRSIPQFLFATVGVILYVIGVSYIDSKIPNSNFGSNIDGLQIGICLLIPFAVIVIQYARRFTAISGALLAGLGAVLVLLSIIAPHESFINKEYPPRELAGLTVGLPAPKAIDSNKEEGWPNSPEIKTVPFWLSMSAAGMGSDSIVKLQGQMITLDSNSGFHWTSNWTRLGTQVFPEQTQIPITFGIDRELFQKIKNSPVRLTVSLLYQSFADEERRKLVIPKEAFTIPEIGHCSGTPSWRSIVCLAALPRQLNLLVSTDLSASTCPLLEKDTPADPGTIARYWEYRPSRAPDPGISPIQPVNLYVIQMNWEPTKRRVTGGLCPGTPITLSHPRFLFQGQQSFTFENVDLSKYAYSGGSRGELRAITQ